VSGEKVDLLLAWDSIGEMLSKGEKSGYLRIGSGVSFDVRG
jgi:hypothetical protein